MMMTMARLHQQLMFKWSVTSKSSTKLHDIQVNKYDMCENLTDMVKP